VVARFDMLARAERMHREIFRPAGSSHHPAWEPPVDILEQAAADVEGKHLARPLLCPRTR
jgi:hypothetical protein